MPSAYDAFLGAQCAQEESQGRAPSVIKLVVALREHSPMGLKEAKDTVDDYLQRRSPPEAQAPAILDYDAWLTARIAEMQRNQEKPDRISLIRDLREQAGLGLKETKDIVDDYCQRFRPNLPLSAGSGLLSDLARKLGLG